MTDKVVYLSNLIYERIEFWKDDVNTFLKSVIRSPFPLRIQKAKLISGKNTRSSAYITLAAMK